MNINSIQFSSKLVHTKSINSKNNNLERSPKYDTISFSASKPKEKKLKPRIQTAVDFSEKLLDATNKKIITLSEIQEIASQYSPEVKVLPMSDLGNKIHDSENYGAFFMAQMQDDFKATGKEIYINIPRTNNNKTQNLLFTMNTAHEFTHLKQMDDLESFNFLKMVSKNNPQYAKAIMGLGDSIFSVFDNQIQASILQPIFRNPIDILASNQYGNFVPRKANVSKQMIANLSGLNSEKDLQRFLKQNFDAIFEKIMISVKETRPEILDMIPENESYESLQKKIKTYCAIKAKDEKEAYTTESTVAKRTLNIDGTINIDAFPMYYDMLEKAFT